MLARVLELLGLALQELHLHFQTLVFGFHGLLLDFPGLSSGHTVTCAKEPLQKKTKHGAFPATVLERTVKPAMTSKERNNGKQRKELPQPPRL